MMQNILLYILLVSPLLMTLCTTNEILSSLNFNNNNNHHIVAMVNDYTLVNKVSEQIVNDNLNLNLNLNLNSFSLQEFKEREIREIKDRKRQSNKNMLNKWVSYFSKKFEFNFEFNFEFEDSLDPFEQRVQNNVDLLNRLIINATDGLLNMCNKMIAKTTSSLPLSYSSYAQFETEMRLKDDDVEDDSEGGGSIFSFFSSSKDKSVVLVKEDLSKAELESEVLQQMYDYQQYRLALNNRQMFLNGLCFNTFGSPYTLYYNSDNNTLLNTYNPALLNYYTIIVQNIVDNGFIRNLNRGFKNQKQSKDKDKNKRSEFNFDVEFDIDKDKKEMLVEKAKYILPILQRLGQRLPTYLADIAKRSLNIDEYFCNLRKFWSDILDESIIASHDIPIAFKLELDGLKRQAEEALKRQLKEEQDAAERAYKAQQIASEKMQKAEEEAQRIKDEYKKKAIIDEARDFVRQSEILFKERQQNFSNIEWQQFNMWFSHQMTKGVNIYDAALGGVGQLLHSTFNIPANIVINFASTQVSEIGKLLILVAGVVIVGLMTLFFVKLFVRRFVRLFWNVDKV